MTQQQQLTPPTKGVRQAVEKLLRLRTSFMEETGLPPSQIMLCSERWGEQQRVWFVPLPPHLQEPYKAAEEELTKASAIPDLTLRTAAIERLLVELASRTGAHPNFIANVCSQLNIIRA